MSLFNKTDRERLLRMYYFFTKKEKTGFRQAIKNLSEYFGKDPDVIVDNLIEAEEKK